jgi:hypothetical protein
MTFQLGQTMLQPKAHLLVNLPRLVSPIADTHPLPTSTIYLLSCQNWWVTDQLTNMGKNPFLAAQELN